MKRPSYREAVEAIALNDNPGDGDTREQIAGYRTTLLIAWLWEVSPQKVANDIVSVRVREDLPVNEAAPF